jgi:ABC-type branched-subunit amino acid transport system substrate-binding protein
MGDGAVNLSRLRARTTTPVLVAALALSSTALAGCLTSSRAATGQAGGCSTQVPGVTATSVKIGLIYPDTGPASVAASFAGTRSAVEARIDQQNSLGGVNGRRIDLVWRDDESDTVKFAAAAHDLVDNQQAFGLIAQSVALDGAASWLQAQGVPVTGAATSSAWSTDSNLFDFGNPFNPGAVSTFGDYVRAQGGTKALIVLDPTIPVSQSLAAKFASSLQSRGVQVVDQVSYTDGITSTEHLAQELRSSGANALVGAIPASAVLDVYQVARSVGARLNVVLSTSGDSASLLTRRGTEMAGVSTFSGFAAASSPAMLAYDKVMSTYAPQVTQPADELTVGGYVAADEMIQGLQLAGACPTRAAFIKNLRADTAFTAGGLLAPVDLSQPQTPDRCFSFLKVDQAGQTLAPVPPPAGGGQGSWCGQALS